MSVDSLSTPIRNSSEFFSKSFDGSTSDVRKSRSEPYYKLKKASSMDEEKPNKASTIDEEKPQSPITGITRSPFSGSIKRRSIKRRPSRKERPEEKNYGNDTATYEAIRVRVLQEKAVVNAIEALQERWRMIMFMYNDCQDLNKDRLERRQMKLDIKRQEELILIILMFLFLCVPIAILFVFISR